MFSCFYQAQGELGNYPGEGRKGLYNHIYVRMACVSVLRGL